MTLIFCTVIFFEFQNISSKLGGNLGIWECTFKDLLI